MKKKLHFVFIRLPQLNGNNNYCPTCAGLCDCGAVQQNGDGIATQIEPKTCNQTCSKSERNNGNSNINKQIIKYHNHAIPGVFNCRFSNPVCSRYCT